MQAGRSFVCDKNYAQRVYKHKSLRERVPRIKVQQEVQKQHREARESCREWKGRQNGEWRQNEDQADTVVGVVVVVRVTLLEEVVGELLGGLLGLLAAREIAHGKETHVGNGEVKNQASEYFNHL